MTVRIAHGFVLTPAPWLRSRSEAAAEPLRAWVVAAPALPAPQEGPAPGFEHVIAATALPASSADPAHPQAARAVRAYAAASESLGAWAVGCYLRVRA